MRVIARLDIKNHNVVKGINYEGLRIVGNPVVLAKKYYEDGVDEIFFIDCVASLYGQNNLTKIIFESTKDVFIPFCVGGGIRSIEDAYLLLKMGADKITINTAALERPKLLTELAKKFGSQCVTLSVEAKKIDFNKWVVYKNFGRDNTEIKVNEWIKKSQDLGVGEIVLTSIDHEGKGQGFDLDLYKNCSDLVNVPLIAGGGFGKLEDIIQLKKKAKVEGVTISQALHYNNVSIQKLRKILDKNNL